MVDISIIIVSFNTKEYLLKCIFSVKEFTSKKINYEVIVVDNGSTDGSVDEVVNIKYDSLPIRLIKNNQNLGFSKANNIGVKQAKGKYLLFLNSDTELTQKNTLETMITFMDNHHEAGAATCIVKLFDNSLDDASHRGFPTPWNAVCHFMGLSKIFPHTMLFNGYHLAWSNLQNVHQIDALAGAFMMVRRKAGEDVGWWDEDYFFYGEDLDFCYRLKQNGWKIYFVPAVEILHHKGISGGIKKHSKYISKADQQTRIRAKKARFDAMKIFYNKHYKYKYPRFLTKLVLGGIKAKQRLTRI